MFIVVAPLILKTGKISAPTKENLLNIGTPRGKSIIPYNYEDYVEGKKMVYSSKKQTIKLYTIIIQNICLNGKDQRAISKKFKLPV